MPGILFKQWLVDPLVKWVGDEIGIDTSKFTGFDIFKHIELMLGDIGDFFKGIFDIDIGGIIKSMAGKLGLPGWVLSKIGLGGGDDTSRPNMSQGADGVVREDAAPKKKGKGMFSKIGNWGSSLFGGDDKKMSVEEKMMRGDYGDGSTTQGYIRYDEALAEEKAAGGGGKKGGGTGGSAVKVSPKKVDLKGIDWDFISKKEGGSKTDGYVPNPEGSKSGVTIATGFDLGARNAEDLKGLPLSLKEKLSPYLGLQGMVASEYLETRPLTITGSEAKLIDKKSKGGAVKKLKAEWNKNAAIMKTPMFEDLTGAQKTIAASVAFQYGSLAKAPKFRAAAQEGRWDDVQGELRNFGDDYASRRTSEADYLQMAAARQNNSGATLNELQVANAEGKSGSGAPMVVAPNNSTTTTVSNGTTVNMEPSAKHSRIWENT